MVTGNVPIPGRKFYTFQEPHFTSLHFFAVDHNWVIMILRPWRSSACWCWWSPEELFWVRRRRWNGSSSPAGGGRPRAFSAVLWGCSLSLGGGHCVAAKSIKVTRSVRNTIKVSLFCFPGSPGRVCPWIYGPSPLGGYSGAVCNGQGRRDGIRLWRKRCIKQELHLH